MHNIANGYNNDNHKISWISLLIAIGLILFIFEAYIPRPLPWLKPGLANISTLLALYLFNSRTALIVVIIRVILGSLVIGTFLNPAFILAISGGITATILMALVKHYRSDMFSIFGISIIGATTHNLVQILLVSQVLIKNFHILYLLPLLMISALFTGIIVALFSYQILQKLRKYNSSVVQTI